MQDIFKQLGSSRSLAYADYIAQLGRSDDKDSSTLEEKVGKEQIVDPSANHQITELPTIEDVRVIVTGESPAAGDYAMTEKEVVRWFRKNWGRPAAPKKGEEEVDAVADEQTEQHDVPLTPQRSALIEYVVKRIVDEFCIADDKKFLRWKE
jgi:hypothetical protein